jgi:hypothetical protein
VTGAAEEELALQQAALDQRVAQSGLYTHEPFELRAAVTAYRALWDRLGLREDLGTLATPESRNVVRKVRLADGREAVAKVIGNVREPGEGEVLAAWRALGLPCVEPLNWGYVRVRVDATTRTAAYLLTEFLDAPTFPRSFEGAAVAERRDAALRLVALIRPFHAADVRISRARSWEDRLRLHLRWTLPLLREQGIEEPRGWEATLAALSAEGRCILHGDPAGANVLVAADGRLVLLDPPGALRGLREADVAQICSQVGGERDVEEVIAAVCDDDPRLDPSAVSALAGLNFLTWAGYFLADHPNPDTPAAGAAQAYVDVARRLLEGQP